MNMITDGFISARRAKDIFAKRGGALNEDDLLLVEVDAQITDAANEGMLKVSFDQNFVHFYNDSFSWLADFLLAHRYRVSVNLAFENGNYRSFDWAAANENSTILEETEVYLIESSEMVVSWD